MMDETEEALRLHSTDNVNHYIIMETEELNVLRTLYAYNDYTHAIYVPNKKWWQVFFKCETSDQFGYGVGFHIGRAIQKQITG